MCAVTYLFEMDVSKTRPLWTPRQLGEWDSFLLEHLHNQHICLVWEACLLGCMRGCVCGCVRMCGVGEVCVGVREGVNGVYEAEVRGTGNPHSQAKAAAHLSSLSMICDLTACDKKISIKDQNAWATYSSNYGWPPLSANPLIQDHCRKWHHTYPNIYMSGAKSAFWRQQSTLYQLI